MRWISLLVVLAACDRCTHDAGAQRSRPPPAAECARDDDCVLLPDALTCCEECPPAPPFEPAPAWVLDGMLIENDTVCPTRWRCPEIECAPVPPGCVARAACRDGRCTAVTTGCDRPAV
jgi:hypothetical protein